MPHKPPRILRHPERKLRPVPARLWPSLAEKYSLPRKSRVYYDMGERLFFTFIMPESMERNQWMVFSEQLAVQGRRALGANCLRFNPGKGFLEITEVGKDRKAVKSERGQMLFRALLNEALGVAKAKGAACIKIQAENEKLASYYAGFGFEFGDPEEPRLGTLRLHKKGRMR